MSADAIRRALHREDLTGGYVLTWYEAKPGITIQLLERNGRNVKPSSAPREVQDRWLTLEQRLSLFLTGDGTWPRSEELDNPETCG